MSTYGRVGLEVSSFSMCTLRYLFSHQAALVLSVLGGAEGPLGVDGLDVSQGQGFDAVEVVEEAEVEILEVPTDVGALVALQIGVLFLECRKILYRA